VPLDTNGQEDVYEFEPVGIGSCSASSSGFDEGEGGCVSLVSSGTSSKESGFLDASANGNDVFFLTGERLVGEDKDTALDVYDARVCSAAEPCAAGAASSSACVTADACRAAPSPQPSVFGAPSSATFAGAGNLGSSSPVAKPKAKPVTRVQKLALALKACKKRPKSKRTGCQKQAHKRFGAVKPKKKPAKQKEKK